MTVHTTNLERENLEAHVDLCAERYKQLDLRLTIIETKVESLAEAINSHRLSTTRVIIGSTATIVTGLLGLITTILMKF